RSAGPTRPGGDAPAGGAKLPGCSRRLPPRRPAPLPSAPTQVASRSSPSLPLTSGAAKRSAEFVNSAERLAAPLVRGSDGALREATWVGALGSGAGRLGGSRREHPGSFAPPAGASPPGRVGPAER